MIISFRLLGISQRLHGVLGIWYVFTPLYVASTNTQANAQYSGSNMDRGFFDTVVSILFRVHHQYELTDS